MSSKSVTNKETNLRENNENKQKNEEVDFKPIVCRSIQFDMDEKTVEKIFGYLKTLDQRITPSELVRGLNGYLSENFEKGWNVFIGSNYYGLCSYEEKCYLEFEAVGFRVIVFKSFCPP